jgi:hypothetical protein
MADPEANKNRDSTDEEIVRWRSFPGRLYAEMVAEALRREGIHCIIKGEDIGFLGGNTMSAYSPGRVVVYLKKSDLPRADEVANDMLDHI